MAVQTSSSVGLCSLLMLSFLEIVLASSIDDHKWERSFLELKVMLSGLDSKVSTVDSKLSHLQLIVSPIDHQLKTLTSRMDSLGQQVESIKETLRSSSNSQLTEVQTEQTQKHGRSFSAEPEKKPVHERGKKKKLLKLHHETEALQKHQVIVSGFENVTFSLNKIIRKVDSVLDMEGLISWMIHSSEQVVANMANQLNQMDGNLREQQSALQRQQSAVQRQLSAVSDHFGTAIERMNENTFLSSPQFDEAIDISRGMHNDIIRFETLKTETVYAANLARSLLETVSKHHRSSETLQTATQNLTTGLDNVEMTLLPLLTSLTHGQRKMHNLLENMQKTSVLVPGSPPDVSEVFQFQLSRYTDGIIQKIESAQRKIISHFAKELDVREEFLNDKLKSLFEGVDYLRRRVGYTRRSAIM